jgi:excisionase family DNA binding protein
MFSALEVANICGVVNQTAINWIRSGHLKAFTTPGGQYRIYAKDFAAFLDKRGMSGSGEVLQGMMENANWNTLLIAMEQFANEDLKSKIDPLFPEYTIIQALDWFEVGRKMTENKPGIVILDADLPGVDLSRFINTVKNDPVFGRPYIFLFIDSHITEDIASIQADLVLSKPPDLEKLETTIRSLEKSLDAAVNA